MEYPIQILFCVVSEKKLQKLQKYYISHSINNSFVMTGEGRAESMFGDLFGFGISDRCVLTACVSLDKAKSVLKDFQNIQHDLKENIVMFSTPVDAISSDLMNMVKIKLGGINGSKE